MKNPIIVLFLFFALSACNDSKKKKESEKTAGQEEVIKNTERTDSSIDNSSTNKNSRELKNSQTSGNIDSKKHSTTASGIYIKDDHAEDTNCNCYCLDIKFSGTSKLCLTQDNLFINGRFEKEGENINVYYSGKAAGNSDTQLPWEEFDTGTPIAVLSPAENGFKFDWKGFSINNEIAIDYALFGKKTLEGTYKKK